MIALLRGQSVSAVVASVAVCLGGSLGGVNPASGAEPVCKQGQASTKAKPCITSQVPTATTGSSGNPVQEGQGRSSQTDSMTVVRFLDPSRDLYQIQIQNTSGIGYINTFNWVPPQGMTITAITSSEGGHCSLSNGAIACTAGGKGIAPPPCTCSVGGTMTVNFTATATQPVFANGFWTYFGVVGSFTQIQSMTPVPYHIPSFVGATPAADLPLCKTGQKNTQANPCATSG